MIEFTCTCERGLHRAPFEKAEISCGALEKLPEILHDYRKIYVVCDQNTFAVCGKRVCELLRQSGQLSHFYILDGETVLPNAEALGKILLHAHDPNAKSDIFAYSPLPDLVLAVGSGTINDCCRLVSYRLGLPYAVCATAPSMDGYVSAGSPILHDGTKSTVQATTPKYLIADLDIVKDAPRDMLFAGLGDMFGKYTGLLDWELARDYTGEYYCEKIAADVLAATNACLENGNTIEARDAGCIENIMHGFLVTGLGMAYTGNSRPASGAEHIIAHAWELADVEQGKKPHLHGLEVCEATRLVAILYEKAANECGDEHLKKLADRYKPYFEKVERFCIDHRVPPVVTDRETVLSGMKRALTLRDRYTILFYLRDRGLYEDYCTYACDTLLSRL